MFSLLLEKEPSDEDIPEEEAEEEEQEEEKSPDEQTVLLNEEIAECFALFEKNNSGTFDTKHLNKALKCLGIFLSSLELEELQETMDTDGVIQYEKFHSYAFDKLTESDPIDLLKIAFQAFDPDNEGVIPIDRFKRWMMTLGNPLTEKEAKELIKLGDPAGKGVLAYDDLLMILIRG